MTDFMTSESTSLVEPTYNPVEEPVIFLFSSLGASKVRTGRTQGCESGALDGLLDEVVGTQTLKMMVQVAWPLARARCDDRLPSLGATSWVAQEA